MKGSSTKSVPTYSNPKQKSPGASPQKSNIKGTFGGKAKAAHAAAHSGLKEGKA